MFKVLLALHILAAVFAIGPLVHAATTASRGVRQKDATAIAASGRLLRVYSIASVVVVVLGFAVMSSTSDYTHKRTADFADTYIWLSLLLWAVAMGLVLAVLVPSLRRAGELVGRSEPVDGPMARIAAVGGIIALIFAGIVFLMVYRA